MGEYCEEARLNGLSESFSKKEPYINFYDNSLWIDVTGRQREIKSMNSLHLCFVINYICSGYCKRLRGDSVYLMRRTLVNRGYKYKDLLYDLEILKIGRYTMYEEEVDTTMYYKRLILKYKEYDWSPLIAYMSWKL